MGPDCLQEIAGSSVVQEKEPLAYSPQGCGTELVGTSSALRYAVGEAASHVVHRQIGKQVHGLLTEGAD